MAEEEKAGAKFDRKLARIVAKELHRIDFAAQALDAEAEEGSETEVASKARITDFKANSKGYVKRARKLLNRMTKAGIALEYTASPANAEAEAEDA